MLDANIYPLDEKVWIVRTATKIIGPFSAIEIAEMLAVKQVTMIDEVKSPKTRWAYLREILLFQELLKRIGKEEGDHSDKTFTHSVQLTKSVTLTKTQEVAGFEEKDDPSGMTPTDKIQDLIPISETKSKPAPAEVNYFNHAPAYGSMNDQRVIEQKKKSGKLIWISAAAVVLILGGMYGVKRMNQKRNEAAEISRLEKDIIRWQEVGLFEPALKAYKRLSSLTKPKDSIKAVIAPSLILDDRQTAEGRSILQNFIKSPDISRTERINANIAIALTYLLDNQNKEAEAQLERVKYDDPENNAVVMNLAVSNFFDNNHEKANELFQIAWNRESNQRFALYGLFYSRIKALAAASESNIRILDRYTLPLKAMMVDVEKTLRNRGYLQQEFHLLMVYADLLLNNRVPVLEKHLQDFLWESVDFSKEHRRPFLVDTRMASWSSLKDVCLEVIKRLNDEDSRRLVKSVCLAHQQSDPEVEKLLQLPVENKSLDLTNRYLQASYYYRMGKFPEATSILKSPEFANSIGANQLLARMCLKQGDGECITQELGKLADHPDAFYFWFSANHQVNDKKAAFQWMQQGLEFDQQFIPLIQLRDDLER